MKSALLITFLLHLQHACFVSGQCIKGDDFTDVVMRKESLLSLDIDGDLDTPRTYIMCPNSRVNVQKYDYVSQDFTGNGTKALSIWNRNVILQCGDGQMENNCRFVGGTYQIEVISPLELFDNNEYPHIIEEPLTNIIIKGFQFLKAKEGNIFIYGADVPLDQDPAADISIVNSKFTDNTGIPIELLYNDRTRLLIKDSKFINNKVQDFGDVGLITVADSSGVDLTMEGNSFVKNNLLQDKKVRNNYIVRLSGDTYKNEILLDGNEFRKNKGINAFVWGRFQRSDAYSATDDNIHLDNDLTGANRCRGIKGFDDLNTRSPICLFKFTKVHLPTVSPAPTLNPTISLQPSSSVYDDETGCIKKRFTQVVHNAELMLTDEEIKKERVYMMCPGTVLQINPNYDWVNDVFEETEGTHLPLRIWNPNVKIMCGTKQVKSTDCKIKGGDFQVEIYDAKYESEDLVSNALKGIIIKGITFMEAEYENILIYGTEPSGKDKGADISIINCIFRDNGVTTVIDILENRNTYLTIDQTTFKDNTLYHYEETPNVGLITAAKIGAFVTITNSIFDNNYVGKDGYDGVSWLIYLGGIPYPILDSGLQISGSTFVNNVGMFNAIAAAGFLYDGDFSAKSNKASTNTYESDELNCQGILRIRKNGGIGGNDYYWECALQFDDIESTVAPTPSPTYYFEPQPECLGSDFTKKISQMEKKLNSTNLSRTRTYTVCKDTVTNVMDWDYNTEDYIKGTGDEKALSIIHSNIVIRCEKKNTCLLLGGTYQMEIIGATVFNNDFEYLPINNVEIIGFNFGPGSSQMEANVVIYGLDIQQKFDNLPTYGSSVTLRNCIFQDIEAVSMIWIYENYNTKLTIDGCTFRNNKLTNSVEAPNAGLILSYVTGDVVITDTKFIKNDVSVVGNDVSAVRSLVYVVESVPSLSGNQHETDIKISDSSFIENTGIDFAPVIVGLWKDGIIEHNNNIYEGNELNNELIAPELVCNGFAHFIQDYYYYDYYTPFTWNMEFAEQFSVCLGTFSVNLGGGCDSKIEPETVTKPDNPDKKVSCKQSNGKDQKEKCKKEWFASTCQRSCCVEACPTEEPTSVAKPDSSDVYSCDQGNKKDQKSKCKKSWFKDVCVVSCCSTSSDDSDTGNKPECKIFTDSKKKVTKPGTNKKQDCKQKKKKDQKKKCEKDYFREVCSNTCCNVGLAPVESNPECKLLDEPDGKFLKEDGSKKIRCEQDSAKNLKKKCASGWFKDICKRSCCEAGFPPVNSKCTNLEQPEEVMKDDGSKKMLTCDQNDQEEQSNKCGKSFFLEVCKKSCCEAGFDTGDDGNVQDCSGLSEPLQIKKPDKDESLNCKQDDITEQDKKCQKDWFADACKKSCCESNLLDR